MQARSVILIVLGVAIATNPAVPLPAHGADEQLPLLVTQIPQTAEARPTEDLSPLSQLPASQARIVRVSADGTRQLLTEGFHSAADPAVSFDAKRVMFAGKRTADEPWNIYELTLNNLQVRQITRDSGNCRQPGYQATLYTIVSTEPWYQLTFVSDMAGDRNEAGTGTATSLYSCKLDGSELRRLTYNLSDDADPFLMLDGRLVYACWQRSLLERGLSGRVALFGVNTDGTDHALFSDVRGLPVKRMPCVTDRGLVVFIESDFGGDGSGQISSLSFRRPLHSYRPITTAEDGYVYCHPSPWPGGRVIVSRQAQNRDQNFDVCLFDPKTGRAEQLLTTPRFHNLQAVALRVMREPDGRSSVVNEQDPHGKLYCLNVNIDDFDDPSWHPPGTARRVRFLEGVAVDATGTDPYLDRRAGSPQCQGSTRYGLPPLARRRVLGEVDIRSDGSFNVELPANIAIQLQTVDQHGAALRTCGWIWTKNREPRGCIGCHEDGELTPENSFVEAMQRRSTALTLPPHRRRTVDFRRDVMPILEKKCVACHSSDGAPPRLDGGMKLVSETGGEAYFNQAYVNLLARNANADSNQYNGVYVDPGRARTSPLVWHLFGRNLARPWDTAASKRQAKPIPDSNQSAAPLTDLERRTFVEWIDFGALWDGITGTDQ